MSKQPYLNVAIVQSTIDGTIAWNSNATYAPEMSPSESKRAWNEIMVAISQYNNLVETARPEVIILPELTLAHQYERKIADLAKQVGAIIIGGCDFKYVESTDEVVNQGLISVPRYWPHGTGRGQSRNIHFGKKHPARCEKDFIESIPGRTGKNNMSFLGCNEVFIIDLGNYGKIGISICADFYDIERYAYYKGRIQHLFIIAYNQDVKSFYYLAEAISRLVFCNVVICNTGHHGGSIAFSLYKEDYKRYIYKHEGAGLYTSQIISLPVEELLKAQQDAKSPEAKKFKSAPPGYSYKYPDKVVKAKDAKVVK